MTGSSQEQRVISGKKMKPASEIEKSISNFIDKLRIACQSGDAKSICELSRALADEVDHVFHRPELWPPERVKAVRNLLKAAATATEGTLYEEDCAARPAEFDVRLQSLREAREAVHRTRECIICPR